MTFPFFVPYIESGEPSGVPSTAGLTVSNCLPGHPGKKNINFLYFLLDTFVRMRYNEGTFQNLSCLFS